MKTSRAPIAIVLCFTLAFAGCAHVKGSPAAGPYSAAVKAAAGISTGLSAVQQQNEILYATVVNATGKRLLSRTIRSPSRCNCSAAATRRTRTIRNLWPP